MVQDVSFLNHCPFVGRIVASASFCTSGGRLMLRVLILAVLVAGAAMVLFAERLGVPGGLALRLLALLFCGAVLALALVSGTSRLARFLGDDQAQGLLAAGAGQAVLLGAAIMVATQMAPFTLWLVVAVMIGFLVTASLMPRLLSRVDQPATTLRSDETSIALVLAAVMASAAIVIVLPQFAALPSARLIATGAQLAFWMLPLVAILAVPGGFALLRIVGPLALTLVIPFVFAPTLVEIIREASALRGEFSPLRLLAPMVSTALDLPPEPLVALAMPLVSGAVAGLLAAEERHLVAGPARKVLLPGVAVVLVGFGAIFVWLLGQEFERILLAEFAGQMPQRWPVFAFDEALGGWLTVCGRAPVDAFDVAQACRLSGVALPLPREALTVDPVLQMSALAASRSMPVMLGAIWNALPWLMLAGAVMHLLLRASVNLSEVMWYRLLRPKALKAWRLVAARLTLIALALAMARIGPEAMAWKPLAVTLVLGAMIALFFVLIGAILRRLVGVLNARRAGDSNHSPREAPQPQSPAPDDTPNPPMAAAT